MLIFSNFIIRIPILFKKSPMPKVLGFIIICWILTPFWATVNHESSARPAVSLFCDSQDRHDIENCHQHRHLFTELAITYNS